ncbi:MAG: phenylalanine--tRNA ligase subunit alpha [Ignavibacteriales bacterium]|nr:phenylalanine--tRNA ligase subunit alpha [Ignavibacteriales bacterium]
MIEKIQELRLLFNQELKASSDLKTLEEIRIKYLSRNGKLQILLDALKDVPKEQKPLVGKELNILKTELFQNFNSLKEQFESASQEVESIIDLSLPGRGHEYGSKHLLIQTLDEIKKIFKGLGFSVYEGPELESDFNNFEALNFAADHPARDMQDTFFVNKNFLLRTHTSPVQVRLMQELQPPIRAIMPGKVYRNEAISSRSYCLFHQVEGLYVDSKVTFADLKSTLVSFARQFYGTDLKYRFRASYFPFTEPSAEMDITCYLCKGKGCRVCKQSGWLEILGCGMVDPNVFTKVGYNPEKVTGYAFGMGIERTALLKYGINDIRVFFDNDIRFLRQF